MAEEKQIKARLQHKTDTAENWQKAGEKGFVPKKGEIIVYQEKEEKESKIKIGDGVTPIHQLQFSSKSEGQVEWKNLKDKPVIEVGQEPTSIIIGEGVARGKYSIAGGTTDKSIVTDITGIDITSVSDTLIEAALGERGPKIKSLVENASESRGAGSLSYGTGNQSLTALSVTSGVATQAGSRGFYIHKVTVPEDGSNITIKLSKVQKPYGEYKLTIFGNTAIIPYNDNTATWDSTAGAELDKYEIDDKVSIILRAGFYLCGNIVTKDTSNGTIIITNEGFITPEDVTKNIQGEGLEALKELFGALTPYQFTLSVPSKPEIGLQEIHFGGIASGLGSIAAGTLSQAHGKMNIAAGQFSFAVGQDNEAGYAAFVEGTKNKALGNNAHSEGYNTMALGAEAHAEGSHTVAAGYASHAEGGKTDDDNYGPVAEGPYSHAEGRATLATGYGAHAEGRHTEVTFFGNYGHAEGDATKVTANWAHAEGQGTIAASAAQHVQGKYNVEDATGTYVHIVGWGENEDSPKNIHTLDTSGNAVFAGDVLVNNTNKVATEDSLAKHYVTAGCLAGSNLGSNSTAEGLDNIASGSYAHAEGYLNKALAHGSHVEGKQTVADDKANYAHAEGMETTVRANAAHAEGLTTSAEGEASHAEGNYTVAIGNYQHVQGQWNELDVLQSNNMSTYAHIVGIGTSDKDRRNGHTVDWDGNGWYAGKVTAGKDPTNNMDLVTLQYLNKVKEDGSLRGPQGPQGPQGEPGKDGKDGSSIGVLNVTVDFDTMTASHTAGEIYDHTQKGGTVYCLGLSVTSAEAEFALFTISTPIEKSEDFGGVQATVIDIDAEGSVEIESVDVPNIDDESTASFSTWSSQKIAAEIAKGGGNVDLTDYVKNTDYATDKKAGVVKVTNYYGLRMSSDNTIRTYLASNAEIMEKTQTYKPIVPSTLDYAVKVGLTTNTETLTAEEQQSALNWLGVNALMGDVETALDGIIAIQNSLIGGDET